MRIPVLSLFYVSQGSTGGGSSLILGKLSSLTILSEDQKGLWYAKQMQRIARAQNVLMFILPVETGGYVIPELREIADYVIAFLRRKETLIHGLAGNFALRERNVVDARNSINDVEQELNDWEGMELIRPVKEDPEYETKMMEFEKQWLRRDEGIAIAKRNLEKRFDRWREADKSLQQDKQKVIIWEEEAQSGAQKQYQEDSDALVRLEGAFKVVSKAMSDLFEQVPKAESVVRDMGEVGVDPFETMDLRRCYANLVKRFKCDDEFGKSTTIMSGMRVSQEGKPLMSYMRVMEEFHLILVDLGVKTIPVEDLVAMVAISGMDKMPRKAFLKQISSVAQTLAMVESGSLGKEKSLLERWKEHVRLDERAGRIGATFESANGGGVKSDESKSNKELLKKQKEASQVLSVAEIAELRKRAVCYDFRDNKCDRGDRCRFSHDGALVGAARKEKLEAERSSLPTSAIVNSVNKSMGGAATSVFGRLSASYVSDDEEAEEEDD
eukprot:gene37076-45738_t